MKRLVGCIKSKTVVTLLFFSIFGLVTPVRGNAETMFDLQDQWGSFQKERQAMESHFEALRRINRIGRKRIKKAAQQVQAANHSRDRNYYRMEYIKQRALHVQDVADELIRMLEEQDWFLKKAARARRSYVSFIRSKQVEGLRDLMRMVLSLEERKLLKCRVDTLATENLVQQVRDDSLSFVLATLLSPPQLADPSFERQIRQCRRQLYNGLENLDRELAYLGNRLESIPD